MKTLHVTFDIDKIRIFLSKKGKFLELAQFRMTAMDYVRVWLLDEQRTSATDAGRRSQTLYVRFSGM